MKLIGSKTEQDLRQQLIKSNKSLFGNEENKRLLEVLQNYFPNMRSAYIIHCIYEQAEDIYKILVDDREIVEIELDRYNIDIEPQVKSISVSLYKQGLSKQNQIKLAVALDLAQKELDIQ